MTEIVETEVVETEEAVPTKSQDKKYTDEQLNKLLAKERREWKSKLETLQTDFDSYKADKEAKELELEEKNKTKVETLKKTLPEELIELLDKLSFSEQLEYLEKNTPAEKKKIPVIPEGNKDSSPKQIPLSIRF